MHRLHQEAARNGLSPLKAIGAIHEALISFNANNSDTWKFEILMIPHLESLEKNVDTMVKNGAIDLENDGYRKYAWILHSHANILHQILQNYEEARSHYEQSLEMQRHVYGPEAKNTDLASTLNNLGELEMELGNYDKARLHYDQSLEMTRHLYGPEAKNTNLASPLDNLGSLEMKLGNYDKARLYYEQSLEMKRHVYGPKVKNTNLAKTLANLGLLEKMIGNFDSARENLEEALAMGIASLGQYASKHSLVEKIHENLGACNV
jgi:tetratricopeptide (TPR) repeat protein